MLRCAHCAADEPEGECYVMLWRCKPSAGPTNGRDELGEDETEQLGEWGLCDECALKYQREFLARGTPLPDVGVRDSCSHCGCALDTSGTDWAGSLSLAPEPVEMPSGAVIPHPTESVECDDALCLPCLELAREFLKEDSGA
jgi:hypothetical protein